MSRQYFILEENILEMQKGVRWAPSNEEERRVVIYMKILMQHKF